MKNSKKAALNRWCKDTTQREHTP